MCLKIDVDYTTRLGEWMERRPGREMVAWKVVRKIGEKYYNAYSLVESVQYVGKTEAKGAVSVGRRAMGRWEQGGGGLHVALTEEGARRLLRAWKQAHPDVTLIKVSCKAEDLIFAGMGEYGAPSATFRKVEVVK